MVVVVVVDRRSTGNITALHDGQDHLARGLPLIINGFQWITVQQVGHHLTRNGRIRTNKVDGLVQEISIVFIAILV